MGHVRKENASMNTSIIDHLSKTADLDGEVQEAIYRLKDLQVETTRLKTLAPVNATPCYHKDAHGEPRYLYLIHPQKNGARIREYIGCKPHRISAALARVQAHHDLAEVLHRAADIRTRLDLVSRYLDAALRAAEGGEV